MIITCGILINKKQILLVKTCKDSDWTLPSCFVRDDAKMDMCIKELMMNNLNIEVQPFHTLRTFSNGPVIITPQVLNYVSGVAKLSEYIEIKFVDKVESKKIKIDKVHKPIVTAFFESYSVLLRKA